MKCTTRNFAEYIRRMLEKNPELAAQVEAERAAMNDECERPSYYTRGKIEVWDFIIDQRMDYCTGCVVKYLARAGHKGDKLTDLKKARTYLDKLIQCEEQP